MNSNVTLSSVFRGKGLDSGDTLGNPGLSQSASSNLQSVEMVMEGERFLKALKTVWEDHVSGMSKLRQILRYMVCSIDTAQLLEHEVSY